MCKILDQYADKIKGSFSFFDRMIINGYFRPFLSEKMRNGALYQLGVLYKDFKDYFMNVTKSLTEHIEDSATELERPIKYLSSSNIRKEDVAKDFLLSDPVDDGLICVLKTLESCKTAKVYGSDSGKLVVKSVYTKCLHYYLYYLDKEYGFMFVKIQTWFPFNIQVYINGRELMKHVFDVNGISYHCYDNSFTDLSDMAKAQELADKFDSTKLCRHLDGFAKSINPFLDTVMKVFGQGYYWCVNQCEFATDVMFKERSFLEDIYPSLVGHAFYDFTCTDVFTFLGRKPNPRFQGEAVSDFKDRPVGCRVKFKLKSNSIKMYDKCSVLRVETTINDPREFKIFGTVHHHDGSVSKQWKPMGKSIANLYRYAEISKSSNARFLDAMVDIVPVKSTLKEVEDICSGKKVNGKRVTGFNVWAPEVVSIMETVCDGRFLVKGFRNIDIRRIVLPEIKDQKKQSSKMSRILKKLRQHGLIKKVPKSRCYHVTSKGRRVMGALIEIRHKEYPKHAAKVS
jgi:hypothetical protein